MTPSTDDLKAMAGLIINRACDSIIELDKVVATSHAILSCTFGNKVPDPDSAAKALGELLEILTPTECDMVKQHLELAIVRYHEGMAKR